MSNNIAIKAENLSKAYQLGEIGTGTISRDLERWYARVRGKEDPFLRIGETNDRISKGSSDIVWSLKDINFEIEQGDAIGIIGRNGAGKSTLLKVLSRVTSPTTGRITGKGRIASLLEVGTGFHPELTGKENIYLNGAILGMRKKEITHKFDEIVDFAGVERYIDTPVKRYSSGMYVRLAFAVAAHLESEILIVDEVLAVGDAEFQKKCLGKMGEVSKGEGRTVLFVSHNMGSIKALCNKGIVLQNGCLTFKGSCSQAVEQYISQNQSEKSIYSEFTNERNDPMYIQNVKLLVNGEPAKSDSIDFRDKIGFEITYEIKETVNNRGLVIYCKDNTDTILMNHELSSEEHLITNRQPGKYKVIVDYPTQFLKQGSYYFDFEISHYGGNGREQFEENAINIDIDIFSRHIRYQAADAKRPGQFYIEPKWHYTQID